MDKTRDSTNSKIWPDSTCAISVRRKRQILLVVEALVLSTIQPPQQLILYGYLERLILKPRCILNCHCCFSNLLTAFLGIVVEKTH